MKKNKKYIQLLPAIPSHALYLEYQKKLRTLIEKMCEDVFSGILKDYKNNSQTVLAMDSVSTGFNSIYYKLLSKWQKIFVAKSGIFAKDFIKNVDNHSKSMLKNSLEKFNNNNKLDLLADKLVVGYSDDTKRIIIANQQKIQDNIDLIRSIPQQFNEKVQKVINQAILNGNTVKELSGELQSIHTMTDYRASFIARDQIRKATSMIHDARMLNVGITQNVWHHSSASLVPRPSHLTAEGTVYNIEQGCLIDGKYIQPAEEPNCACYATAVILISE